MGRLHVDQFAGFFQALYGKPPFPWQSRLAARVCEGDWPRALALPTASGKTACLEAAVFALACQADWPADRRTAPRRIFFVVDRRVIVDEAYERARNLTKQLRLAGKGILKQVADALRRVAGTTPGGDGQEDVQPLACFQLRGGIYRDDAWARTPTQPTVIATTVDQVGSRLLFRSYGRSFKAWPMHAGLAGNDALILLDEAHCARPFQQTMDAIAQYRTWGECPPKNPFHFVLMSATPPPEVDGVFELQKADYRDKELGRRLRAGKPTRLVVADKAKGASVVARMAEVLVAQAVELSEAGLYRIAILVNTVGAACEVERLLRKQKNGGVVLLTGRMRPLERDQLMEGWHPEGEDEGRVGLTHWFGTSDDRPTPPRPLFVVATQCLEVGANLDFDGLVSECASLDALRQRFGRLNRMGRPIQARGVIVIPADKIEPKADDPIYGPSLPRTWRWLKEHAKDDTVDLGILSVADMLPEGAIERQALLAQLQPPSPNAPVMLPAHVETWMQTAPEPEPSPDVSLFLHGPDRGSPEIQVCWRADLRTDPADEQQWIDTISLCPPLAAECATVPLHVLRRWWLSGKPAEVLRGWGDVEGAGARDTEPESPDSIGRIALRWLGPDDSEMVDDPDRIRPGDTIVLPVQTGGEDVLGQVQEPPARHWIDVADWAYRKLRGQATLRLPTSICDVWPESSQRRLLRKILSDTDVPEDTAELLDALRRLATDFPRLCPSWFARLLDDLSHDPGLKVLQHPSGGLVLRGEKRLPTISEEDAYTHEDDTASATVSVPLTNHCENVAAFARAYAEQAGLPAKLVEDVVLAAKLHDLGKSDCRFQAWLHNGNPVAAELAPKLLAKSARLPQDRKARHLARQRSGYPRGARHELLSARLAEKLLAGPGRESRKVEVVSETGQVASIKSATPNDPELVLHLIAGHHGFCRPFAPSVEDLTPATVVLRSGNKELRVSSDTELDRVDSGVPERFWTLVRRYGYWGLAWLEAILILADHRCSEAEEKRKLL